MNFIPANDKATAYVIFPGETKVLSANVIAWAIDESGNLPPKPIIAPGLAGARVAVRFNEGPQLFVGPSTMHASVESFVASR